MSSNNEKQSPLKTDFQKTSRQMLALIETLEAEGIHAEVVKQALFTVFASRLSAKHFDFYIALLKTAKTVAEKNASDSDLPVEHFDFYIALLKEAHTVAEKN